MLKVFLCSLLVFCSADVAAEPCVDIIKSTALRTHKYPLKKYKKIDVCAPSRTGSTLMYNICRFLFENLEVLDHSEQDRSIPNRVVLKSENIPCLPLDSETLMVCTIRNPMDTCFSLYRCESVLHEFRGLTKPVLKLIIDEHVSDMSKVGLLTEKSSNIFIMKYEDFASDFEKLFKSFEVFFDIKIDPYDRALIKQIFSKDSITKCTKQFNSFANYDPRTHIHGNHIDMGEISADEKKIINQKIAQELSGYKSFFKKWGYYL